MTVEDRLREALGSSRDYEPSPDLFVKVQRSIEEDRAHRRRVIRNGAGVAGFTALLVAWFAVWWDPQPGLAPLPWWSVTAAVVAIEVALVAVVGPAIRRFGRTYADDVFRAGPGTGERFLALIDVAYYLIFAGYIAATIPFRAEPAWLVAGGLADLAEQGTWVIGALLVVMGVLHAATIFALPFAGLVFASTRHHRFVGETKDTWHPEVRRAHRTVSLVLIVVGVVVAFELVGLVLGALVGVLGS